MSNSCKEDSGDLSPVFAMLSSGPQDPEGVGGAGVTYYPRPPHLSVVLPSVDGAVIAAFSKVLLPLWLCIVFTAYMFGPAS